MTLVSCLRLLGDHSDMVISSTEAGEHRVDGMHVNVDMRLSLKTRIIEICLLSRACTVHCETMMRPRVPRVQTLDQRMALALAFLLVGKNYVIPYCLITLASGRQCAKHSSLLPRGLAQPSEVLWLRHKLAIAPSSVSC